MKADIYPFFFPVQVTEIYAEMEMDKLGAGNVLLAVDDVNQVPSKSDAQPTIVVKSLAPNQANEVSREQAMNGITISVPLGCIVKEKDVLWISTISLVTPAVDPITSFLQEDPSLSDLANSLEESYLSPDVILMETDDVFPEDDFKGINDLDAGSYKSKILPVAIGYVSEKYKLGDRFPEEKKSKCNNCGVLSACYFATLGRKIVDSGVR